MYLSNFQGVRIVRSIHFLLSNSFIVKTNQQVRAVRLIVSSKDLTDHCSYPSWIRGGAIRIRVPCISS